jgi:hypothetical protein
MRMGRRDGGALLWTLLVLVVLSSAGTPILLHFTQKAHDRLPFDVVAQFPPDGPPTKGEAFATTAAALIEHELRSPTGWRPNDFVLWGPRVAADNNANRQLGIIQALRESVRVLKDHLTKVSSDEYDQNLVLAETAFRNDPLMLWLPSAESKVLRGRAAAAGLRRGTRDDPAALAADQRAQHRAHPPLSRCGPICWATPTPSSTGPTWGCSVRTTSSTTSQGVPTS